MPIGKEFPEKKLTGIPILMKANVPDAVCVSQVAAGKFFLMIKKRKKRLLPTHSIAW